MKQHTFRKSSRTEGLGLHTGLRVRVAMHSAPIDHGIAFARVDLPGHPRVQLGKARVCDTTLCTGLEQQGVRVRTVEHLLAALSCLGIDNALIEIDAEEVPILDGSSAPWVHLINEAGLEEQNAWRKAWEVCKPHIVHLGSSWLRVAPETSFRRRVQIEFDHPSIDRTPLCAETNGDAKEFCRLTGRARTFGFLHQVEDMHARGLAQGGSLDNAMVLDEHRLINEDGLRMPDEFAQHKLLDLIGDLMVLGAPMVGLVEAHRPGHSVQAAFTQTVLAQPGVLRAVRLTDHGMVSDTRKISPTPLVWDAQPAR